MLNHAKNLQQKISLLFDFFGGKMYVQVKHIFLVNDLICTKNFSDKEAKGKSEMPDDKLVKYYSKIL